MQIIRLIFNACAAIMEISINLFGYSVTLWNVFFYGFVIFVIGSFIFKLMR